MRFAGVVLAVAAATATAATIPDPVPYGHAAYVYPPLHCTKYACDVVASCNKARWASDIAAYNKGSTDKTGDISVVYAYGGDIEFWAGKDTPDACARPASTNLAECNVSVFFDPNNAAAAEIYAEQEGVESIVTLLDSRMDGWNQIQTYNNYDACNFGDFYPDLTNLTDFSLRRLANDTANLYCANNLVRGVQIDLEPYKEPYKAALQDYVTYLASNLLDEDKEFGCRNEMYPNGRSVSYFTFAHNHKRDFLDALGPNGYFVFSGYDLFPKDDAFSYNNVSEFKTKLAYEINFFRPLLGTTGRFTIGLPISASCHEYEQYVPMRGDGCGPACTGLTNTAKMADYVQGWFDVILSEETTTKTGGLFCLNETAASQFVGISLWGFSFEETYPPMKWFANDFLPASPDQTVMEILRVNLPKLSDGTTCITHDKQCDVDTGRPNGCKCDHSYECKSEWCSGVCSDKPPAEWDYYTSL